jgi:hypothetical protein
MNLFKGIALKLISALLFAAMSALVRDLGKVAPVGQMVFFRSAFAILPVVVIYAYRGELVARLRMFGQNRENIRYNRIRRDLVRREVFGQRAQEGVGGRQRLRLARAPALDEYPAWQRRQGICETNHLRRRHVLAQPVQHAAEHRLRLIVGLQQRALLERVEPFLEQLRRVEDLTRLGHGRPARS